MCVLVAQSCPTLGHSMDCSLPGSSVHGILQARILEWVAISFSSKVIETDFFFNVREYKKVRDMVSDSDCN